jgi:hypothetical protein
MFTDIQDGEFWQKVEVLDDFYCIIIYIARQILRLRVANALFRDKF